MTEPSNNSTNHKDNETEQLSIEEVEQIIEDVEAEVLAEDKLGASRNDVVEGTCQRIVRRLQSVHADTNQGDH